ncbi:HAD-IIIA family hydrolase [Flexivirga sp. B27]
MAARALTDAELLGEERSPIPRPPCPGRPPRPAGSAGAPYDLILLDRDGTLNVHRPGYVADPADLELLPGAAGAVAAANRAGCAVVLVTNQRGMATGALSREELLAVHRTLIAQLAREGATLDGIQVCPHDRGTCDCRKPRGGLIREALRRAGWAAPDRCVMVGDQPSDLAAAATAGVSARGVAGAGASLRSVIGELLQTGAASV